MPEVTTAAFADDIALMATGKDPDMPQKFNKRRINL